MEEKETTLDQEDVSVETPAVEEVVETTETPVEEAPAQEEVSEEPAVEEKAEDAE